MAARRCAPPAIRATPCALRPAVAGCPGWRCSASVRNSCCAMTLLLNLLMSRTTSASGGDLSSKLGFRPAGALPSTHAARQLAAHVAPQRLDQARVVAGRIGIGHRPVEFAAGGRVAAGKAHPQRVGEIGLQAAAPVVAGPGRQAHRAVHLGAGQHRIDPDQGHAARHVGHEAVGHRLEVQQQRIGLHVVGAGRVAVELGRVSLLRCKGAAVEHDVATDLAHAQLLHAAQQQPHALDHQLRDRPCP